jgi:hypothetical protein
MKCRDICLFGCQRGNLEKTVFFTGKKWLFYRENKPKTEVPRLGLEPRTL